MNALNAKSPLQEAYSPPSLPRGSTDRDGRNGDFNDLDDLSFYPVPPIRAYEGKEYPSKITYGTYDEISMEEEEENKWEEEEDKRALSLHYNAPYFDEEIFFDAANEGLLYGIPPVRLDESTGGVYFLRDRNGSIQLVLKPGDEENEAMKRGGVMFDNSGMYREVAAYILDSEYTHFAAGVPMTCIAAVHVSSLQGKVASAQVGVHKSLYIYPR